MRYKPEVGFAVTRDGRKARVLCIDAPGEYPCVGYVEPKGSPWSWTIVGSIVVKAENSVDLVGPWIEPAPKKPRRVAWVNQYGGLMSRLEGEDLYKHGYERVPGLDQFLNEEEVKS